jgi:probable F420-dependent oxidoreductase
MTAHPFRFGVSVWRAGSREEWRAKARRAEELGYSTLLVPDHLAAIFPPLVPLVSAADATTRLRVGTLVLNNDFRHPVLAAREAAAIDLLTDGRFELGIGAGHMRSEYEQAGIPFDPANTRIDRLTESVAIIKGLLTGETVTFAGQHYQVAGHSSHPTPVQQPHPPLLIGGNNRRVLELAAREADIVGFTGFGQTASGNIRLSAFTSAGTAERIGWVREAAGNRFNQLELNALVQSVIITDDRRTAAQDATEHLPALTPDDILDSPYLLIGTADEIAADLLARRERLGISYYVVFEPAMESLAPVVERLTGT